DMRFRPARREQRRRIAGPATEIGDTHGRIVRHTRQQIGSRPRALVGVGEIFLRVPAHGARSGMKTRNVVPPAPVSPKVTSPPCNRVRSRAIESPNPDPPGLAAVANG